jgi:hypothetical protein
MKNHSEMIKNPFESIFKNFTFKSVLVLLIILFNCVIFFYILSNIKLQLNLHYNNNKIIMKNKNTS